jgi:hypothetical protein
MAPSSFKSWVVARVAGAKSTGRRPAFSVTGQFEKIRAFVKGLGNVAADPVKKFFCSANHLDQLRVAARVKMAGGQQPGSQIGNDFDRFRWRQLNVVKFLRVHRSSELIGSGLPPPVRNLIVPPWNSDRAWLSRSAKFGAFIFCKQRDKINCCAKIIASRPRNARTSLSATKP